MSMGLTNDCSDTAAGMVWLMGGVSQGSRGREAANPGDREGEEEMGRASENFGVSTFSCRRHFARRFWNHT
jgi:hypothetical protein